MRVGLFSLLGARDRARILETRDAYLRERWERMAQIGKSREIGGWGSATLRFAVQELERERNWIAELRTLQI
jgi:hypothetical protein